MKRIEDKRTVKAQALKAYADCNQDNREQGLKQRELMFKASMPVNGEQLSAIMIKAVPGGYNEFDSKQTVDVIRSIFGDDAEYFIAREYSVCLYIRPKVPADWNAVSQATSLSADEFSVDETGLIRLRWD